MVTCSLCNITYSSLFKFKIHFKISHKDTVYSKYSCGEKQCSRTFGDWKGFRKHLVTFHKFPLENNSNTKYVSVVNNSSSNSSSSNCGTCNNDNDNSEVLEDVDVGVGAVAVTPKTFQESYQHSVQVLLAKLYKNPALPRNFVQTFLDDVDNFLTDGFIEILKNKVIHYLKSSEALQSCIDEVSEMFDVLSEPFNGLDTDYKRMQSFTVNDHYIPPIMYTISESRFKSFKTSSGPIVKRVKTTGQFIPLRKVLKKLFELPGSLSETLKYVQSLKSSNTEVISNVIQGQLWLSKTSKFSSSDIVFPLTYYFDEVESNAALGPHSEKLGAGYLYIPVLPPACQSKLENILLSLLISADDRKSTEPGRMSFNKEVFQPFINECNFLETEGISCNTVDLGKVTIYFVLLQVIGDNLGVHSITGFVEGFTANFPCTVCRASKEQTKVMTREDPLLLRDPVNYAEDVEIGNASLTGVKEMCVFNDVKSFHIAQNYTADFMHDGPEGMCHYVLIKILKHFIDCEYVSPDVLNSRMFYFDYGPSDSNNKPPCLADDFQTKSKIKCTAREMLSLVRLLGVIIGDLIPSDDPYWQLYKLHRQIIEICQAKHLNLDMADQLDLLVHEHHSLYLQLVKEDMQPKFHYFVHYGRLTRLLGPVSHFSSFRGEAKHRHIKNYSNSISSRRNLPLSAAKKHQLSLCFRFISNQPLLHEMECGPGGILDLEDHYLYHRFKSSVPHLDDKCERVSWVDFHGTRYEPRMVLVLDTNDEFAFKFGKIFDIFVYKNHPMFVCNVLKNIGFCDHVGGFAVNSSSKFICVWHHALFDPFPLYDFPAVSGERFVILKHYL